MILQHFGGEYDSVEDIFEDIRKELERLQPIDSDTIKHTISSNGVISHAVTSSGAKTNRGVQLEDSIVYDTKTDHQFKISDISTVGDDGTTVYSIHVSAGVLNGVVYNETDIVLPTKDAPYYVYALRGNIYVLTHLFSSNLFPVLLIGTIKYISDKLDITQRSFLDNTFVATQGTSSTYVGLTFYVVVGVNIIRVKLTYENNILSCECSVRTEILVNATPMESEYLSMPKAGINHLYAYCEKLIVDNNTKPKVGFVFGFQAPTDKEWVKEVLEYTHNSTEISAVSGSECPHLFTFTRLFLNAEEDTADV